MLSVRLPVLLFFALAGSLASAEIRLPKILSSHMVLQRDGPIHIWGWSEPGEKVSVTLGTATEATVGDKLGRWSVYLPPHSAGGPFELSVAGSNRLVLNDVLIGDVWLASGQSNMEMPLKGFGVDTPVNNSAAEIADANQPNIRLLFVPHRASDYPLDDVDQSWTACTPETATNFSAAAYFFGRELTRKEKVPIGLIDATWGGTPAEAWVSLEGLSSDASLMPVFASHARMTDQQSEMISMRKAEKAEDTAAQAAGKPTPKHPWHPDPASWAPAALYNGMIAPAIEFPIKGVIWYQGESNSSRDRAPLYRKVFSTLISDWRARWREGNFPFLFVQISTFKASPSESWPIVREAQRRTLDLTNTAMTVTIDIGNPDNIHPADKQAVGIRLALGARALAYGETIEDSGPLFRQVSAEKGGLRVWFDHVGAGLIAKDGDLEGFEVAGPDHRFTPAAARIDGKTVVITAPAADALKYVRYGWANVATGNLFNAAGLPASPFTSEETIPTPSAAD